MTKQEALDYIREHLTTFHANPNIYEDGTHNVIHALEDIVVPMLEKEIEIHNAFEAIFDSLYNRD